MTDISHFPKCIVCRMLAWLIWMVATLFSESYAADTIGNTDNGSQFVHIELHGEKKKLVNTIHTLIEGTQLACDAPRWKIKQTLDDDIERIQESLHAYGYYHAEIQRMVTKQPHCWAITLTLQQGPRVHIKEVDIKIEGAAQQDSDFMQSIQGAVPNVGDSLKHEQYEQLKKAIVSTAGKRGYFDGRFTTRKLWVDQSANTARIVLHYDSGVRYRIGALMIEQDALNEELFNKYVTLKSEQPFNDRQLVSTYQGLSASGYFSLVEVSPLLEQRHDGLVPVQIKAVRGKPRSYSVGIGASTDTGPRLKASYANTLSNKRGHSHRTDLSLSPVISSLGFSYRVPDEKPQTDFYEFSSSATHENTDSATSDTLKFGVGNTRLLENNWQRVISLQYSIDDFDVGEDNDTTQLLRPTLGFSKTASDSPLRPKKGYRLNLEMTGASQAIVSDIDFGQAQINAKYIHSLGKRFRALTRLDLGYTFTNSFEEVPSNLRFYAGGDNSVRGYDFESLGPEDDAGDVVGGRGLIVGSLEMEYEVLPKWSGAVFVDSGNAFNEDRIDLKDGAGFGVRWQSPIGPIRVDLGFPIDDPEADHSFRIHFSLGPDL